MVVSADMMKRPLFMAIMVTSWMCIQGQCGDCDSGGLCKYGILAYYDYNNFSSSSSSSTTTAIIIIGSIIIITTVFTYHLKVLHRNILNI